MEAEALFTGLAVSDFEAALAWYERFFGRRADVVAHEHEVMWRVSDRGWLYIVRDAERAGRGIAALAVSNLEEPRAALGVRGIKAGPIERQGDAGWKATTSDPTATRSPSSR